MILEKIKKPNDIHKIPLEDFEPLAAEITYSVRKKWYI